MLTKIREKSQGVFAWVILLLICVPFALWGIQNYIGGGTETAVVSVGDKDFFQNDVTKAYTQYSQNLANTNLDENTIKKQALEQLIKDEILFQYVQNENLLITDKTAKDFIKSLEYFQTNGSFDEDKYKVLLGGQEISSNVFVHRIKKSLKMEQFQRSIIESSFVTQSDIENFFRIQNQQREVEIISIALQKVKKQPTAAKLESYYQQHKESYLSTEQVAIEYVELSLDKLAEQASPATKAQLQDYYVTHKDFYTSKERRKISHILFAFTDNNNQDVKQLERALKAKQALQKQDFAVLAAKISDDKLTAIDGGNLGIFSVGVMEKAFEDVASKLKLNEVSGPVKSAFGYHLIKVTELEEAKIKPFDLIKEELTAAYQREKVKNNFYEFSDILTEVSFENPDSLQAVVDALPVQIKQTGLFTRTSAVKNKSATNSIITQVAIIDAAFSEDVLKGNNSDSIELDADRLIVLRILEHKPAKIKPFMDVKMQILDTLLRQKALKITQEKAEKINNALVSGIDISSVAKENDLEVQYYPNLTRTDKKLNWQIIHAVFKAAKPINDVPTVVTLTTPDGTQTIINLLRVTEGVIDEHNKNQRKLIKNNMAKAFGIMEHDAVLNNLRADTHIKVW